MKVCVSYASHPSVVSAWQPFSVVIANPCATATINLSNSVVSNTSPSYTVGASTLELPITVANIVDGMTPGLCPSFTMSVVNADDSNKLISVSTATSSVFSNDNSKISCSTSDRLKAGTYNLKLIAKYTDANNFYTNEGTLAITWTIVDPCPTATLTLASSPFTAGTYNLGNITPLEQAWTSALFS